MMNYRLYLATFSLVGSMTVSAQNFDTLLNTVVSNNTELMSSFASTRSDILSMKSDNNLPDPEVEFGYQWGYRDAEDKLEVSVTQGLDWPGVYIARNKANKLEANALRNLNRSNYLDKRLEIKKVFIDIVNVGKRLALLHNRLDILDEMMEKYSAGVKGGELTVLDLKKLRIEKLRLKTSLESLERERDMLKATLTALNGGNACDDIIAALRHYPDETVLPYGTYITMLEENDPSARYADLMVEAQTQRVKVEKRMRFPGLTLGYQHTREDGEVFNGIIVGLRLPAFSTRHKIKAAEALRNSLEYDGMTVAVSKRATLGANRDKALSLFRQMSEFDSVIHGDNTLELLKKALDGGQISLLEYLVELDYYLQVEQDYLDVQYQYFLTLADLNKFVPLD